MKRTIALAILLTCALSAETKLKFNIQSNSALCSGSQPIAGPACPPEDFWKAGVMALAANDDTAVIGYLFTVTARLKDGSPFTGTAISEKWQVPYTAAVVWIGKEPSDFTDVRVTVETLRKDGGKVEAVTAGIEAMVSLHHFTVAETAIRKKDLVITQFGATHYPNGIGPYEKDK